MKEIRIDKNKLSKEELRLLEKIRDANIKTNFVSIKIEFNNHVIGKKAFVIDNLKKEDIEQQTIDKVLSEICRNVKLELAKFVKQNSIAGKTDGESTQQ